jgi:hypothetical protein
MSATLRARVVGSATTESGAVVESEDMAAGRRRGRRRRKVQGGSGPAVGFRRREARERWRGVDSLTCRDKVTGDFPPLRCPPFNIQQLRKKTTLRVHFIASCYDAQPK